MFRYKKCFDSVEINIMTDTGVSVPFNSGKSFVVLEFRRAAYKYFVTGRQASFDT